MNAVREGVCLVGLLVLLTSDEGLCVLSPQQRADIDTRLSRDMATPPFYYTGNLTEVDLQLVMTNVRFSDENMADFTFYSYQIWRDERLAYPDIANDSLAHHVVRQIYFDNIWLVESYVENELHSSVHDSVLLNRFVWIFPNGTIVYSIRLTVGLACNLQAIQFPIGEFICNLKYRIHSYSKDLVLLKCSSQKPIVFTRRAQQESVDTKQWRFSSCDADDSAGNSDDCDYKLLPRDIGCACPRLQAVHGPSLHAQYLCCICGLAKFLDRSVGGLGQDQTWYTLPLAIITEEVGIKFLLPTNIQLDAVDVWFCANLVFVLIAIVEYTFVHAVDCYQEKLRKEQEAKLHIQVSKENAKSFGGIDGLSMKELQHPDTFDCDRQTSYDVVTKTKADKTWLCWSRVLMTISTGRVEKYARIVYAIAFVVFQIFYWVYYLNYKSVVQPSEPDFDVACTGD